MSLDPHCIFCKIVDRKIPAKIVYEDEWAAAFEDANPQAPVHTLVIPKTHIPDMLSITEKDRELVGHLFSVANKIAQDKGFAAHGYRMVINNGRGAGQTVFHIHLHLLAGRHFSWPPG